MELTPRKSLQLHIYIRRNKFLWTHRDETNDLSLKVDFLDLDDFIKDASPEIIKEIILNKAEIDKENDEFIAKKKKEIEAGKLVDDQDFFDL